MEKIIIIFILSIIASAVPATNHSASIEQNEGSEWIIKWWDGGYQQRIEQNTKNEHKSTCIAKLLYYTQRIAQSPDSEYNHLKLKAWKERCADLNIDISIKR